MTCNSTNTQHRLAIKRIWISENKRELTTHKVTRLWLTTYGEEAS